MTRLFLFLLLLLPVPIFSQPFSTSLDVPALSAGRVPTRSRFGIFSFDKRVVILASGGPEGTVCLYINTRSGDIGIQFGPQGERETCRMNVNDESFRFALYRPTGQVESYMTLNKNGVLKHYVSIGRTEVRPVSFPAIRKTTVYRQAETDSRPPIVSQAYRGSAGPTVYLYGRTHPRDLTVQDFLGFGAIGYVKTNRGIFMATRADTGSASLDVAAWQDVRTRFDPGPFVSVDVEANNALADNLEREERKLRPLPSSSSECAPEELQLRRMKQADIASRRELMAQRNSGNIYESEAARIAAGKLILPNIDVMRQEFAVKVCRANLRLQTTRNATTRVQTEERIQCYQNSQDELARIQEELPRIEERYRRENGRNYLEKVEIQRRLMALENSCR